MNKPTYFKNPLFIHPRYFENSLLIVVEFQLSTKKTLKNARIIITWFKSSPEVKFPDSTLISMTM